MSREIGIPWSDPMVLALLRGTKHQTRRAKKGERCKYRVGDRVWGREAWGVSWGHGGWVDGFTLNYRADGEQVPFFPPEHSMPDTIGKIKTLHEKWRPPMFMPRWASRLLHEVTAVRAERLLDITEADVIAEGIERVSVAEAYEIGDVPGWRWPGREPRRIYGTARACYLAGYDMLHGAGASALNPWVWVISFTALR